MRAILIAVLLAIAAAAQTPIPAARLPELQKYFDAQPGELPLQCEFVPIKPSLGFSLRFQAGYMVGVPLNQYVGEGHRLIVATRITPEGGQPAYLFQRFRLGKIPATHTHMQAELDGGYMLGEGRYGVECAVFDDSGRVSRKKWRIEARRGRGERDAKLAIPPGTVSPFAVGVRPVLAAADAAPSRLTILLHAAPLSPGRTRLRASDLFLLFTGHLPAGATAGPIGQAGSLQPGPAEGAFPAGELHARCPGSGLGSPDCPGPRRGGLRRPQEPRWRPRSHGGPGEGGASRRRRPRTPWCCWAR